MVEHICPFCNSNTRQVKAGMKNDRQQYKCMSCGRRYVEERKKSIYPESLKQKAIELHKEGYSLNQIGATLGVIARTVGYWLQKAGSDISAPQQESPQSPFKSTTPAEIHNEKIADLPIKRRVTIHDVAREAAVAPSTISNYLNNKGRMNAATRERIKEAIKTLRYTPNAMTRAIRRGRTKILGIVSIGLWDFDEGVGMSIAPPILAGVNKTAQLAGYDVLMYTHWISSKHYGEIRFLNGNIDGLLCVGPLIDDTIMEQTAEAGLPIMTLLTRQVPDNVGYVDGDNIGAMYKIVNHLISIGRKRIGFYSTIHDSNHIDRYQGFRDAMRNAGLSWDSSPMKFTIRQGEAWNGDKFDRGIKCLLNLANEFDAIVVPNDHWAILVIENLRNMGYRVPDDIAVVGFNDVRDAALAVGGITTIKQPFHKMGQTGVERLLAMIEGAPASDCRIVLPTELVVRNSTMLVPSS